MATAKAQKLSRELANRLRIRFAEAGVALTTTEGADASANPTITINDGTPATGEQAFFIRIDQVPDPTLGVNSIGQAQPSYGPLVVQVVTEATAASATTSIVTAANTARAMGEIMRLGTRVEVYVRANGSTPVVGDITVGNLVYTMDDLYFPLLATV
jgi:predicted secreted protein